MGGAIQYREAIKGKAIFACGRDEELYAAARLHLIRPLRGHLPLKGKA